MTSPADGTDEVQHVGRPAQSSVRAAVQRGRRPVENRRVQLLGLARPSEQKEGYAINLTDPCYAR